MKGWRTIAFNVLSLAAAALAFPELAGVVPPQYLLIAVPVVNIALRLITTGPVGTKE